MSTLSVQDVMKIFHCTVSCAKTCTREVDTLILPTDVTVFSPLSVFLWVSLPNNPASPVPSGTTTKLQPKPPTRLPEAEFVQFPLRNGATPPAKNDVDGAVSTAIEGSTTHNLATPFTEPFSAEVVVKGAGNAGGLERAQRSLKDSGHSVGLDSEPWPRWGERALRSRAAGSAPSILFFYSQTFFMTKVLSSTRGAS